MKRSDVIKILFDKIDAYSIGGKLKHLTFQECAEDLLNKLEEIGMAPPEAEILEECSYFDGVKQYKKKRVWEKE